MYLTYIFNTQKDNMIKLINSVKFLKLCLFGLLISSIMFVWNFLNSYYFTVWGGSYDSPYNNDFSITPIKWWNFLSSFLWQAKGLLAVNQYDLFWWSSRWVPYVSLSWYAQGYYSSYWLCDELTSTDQAPTNCFEYSLDPWYTDNLKSFFKSLQDWDLIYYDFVRWYDAYYPHFKADVCWSSSAINKSLCFRYNFDKRAQWCVWCYGSLVNSEWFQGLTFFNINTNILWYAPWQWMYNWWVADVETWNIVEIPPELMTNQDIMSYFQDTWGWDRDMCYVWTTDLSSNYSWDYTRLWGYTIFEAYSILYSWTNVSNPNWLVTWTNTMNVGAWINTLYNNYYTYYVKRLDYINYEWNPLHYSFRWNNWLYSVDRSSSYYPFNWRSNVELALWSKYYNRYQNTDQNWQDIAYYCSAVLSPSGPNEVYSWSLPNYLVNNINWQINNQLNQSTDWQNSSYQVPSWSWFMLSWNEDFGVSLKNFYAKLTEKMNVERSNFPVNWIIPDYILWFLTLIILFWFLKK
jgi:hypothetical protein